MQDDNIMIIESAPKNPRGQATAFTMSPSTNHAVDDDSMICSPTQPTKPAISTDKILSSHPPGLPYPSSPPLTPKRRAIFNAFWEKSASSSSILGDDNCSEGSGREAAVVVKQSPKLQPSYLGIYSFAPPSPMVTSSSTPSKPSVVVSPSGSSDSLTLTPSPSRPKSILRRNHSLRERRVAPPLLPFDNNDGPEPHNYNHHEMTRRNRSASLQFPFVPSMDDASSVGSKSSSKEGSSEHSNYKSHQSPVRQHITFDPTITVREVIDEHGCHRDDPDKNWFSDSELGSFMKEAVNLCHSSAINAIKSYSLPSVAKAYAAAHEAGIKEPVLSSTLPEYRALFADPVLHATEEDAIVHDGSKKFFKIMAKEVQRVLIVDSSPTTLKLFRRHVLCMFPHVKIDLAMSGEEALNLVNLDCDQGEDQQHRHRHQEPRVYDIVITEEHLHRMSSFEDEEHKEEKEEEDRQRHLHEYQSSDLLGSELLQLINDFEASAARNSNHLNDPKASYENDAQDDDDDDNDNESPSSSSNSAKALSSSSSSRSRRSRKSIKIGVSSSLGEDCESLRKGGADLFWGKPPPKPSNGLRNQLLNTLLGKRGKSVFICGC